ncbi:MULTISPECIES: sulfur carrier protein ThiS [Pseudophaeobacter]|jgi:sulfur carrier protein|uniref:sulfur carrier protein ThiS n=1 Tax=Pseudophaeobacter TaxID=1541822 RepID=UPI001E3EC7B7|nr:MULTISPECIES: sulfur carrier protein ThiS [Pseudophaeobacter]MCD9146315.1 sulfur carrier protein ThiS [Pseudophaeobacter flagellatus]
MQIIVNAQAHEVRAQTLEAALCELGFTSPAIATALNGVFVSRAKRSDVLLTNGDRLEVLAPMQGG